MNRKLPAILAALLVATAAVAQQPSVEDLRPDDLLFPDSLGIGAPSTPELPKELGRPGGSDALSISGDIFGPNEKVDEAYGAFQRGYYLTALELALPRAQKADAAAQTLIAELYTRGLGVPESQERAASWYSMASGNGDRTATFELALMYQEGRGVTKNREKAAELFQQAADRGSIPAKYNLALLHIEGKFAKPDMVKAAALIREAAESGMPEARYDYGGMLMEGAGVAPNAVLGAEQIGLAAKDGLVDAQVDYATLLYLGNGLERDIKQAASWYARAAASGNPVAQNRYAKLLAVGEGVEPDLEEAAMWRVLARRQGLTDPVLDKLLVSILPAELSRAEERARYWPGAVPTAEPAPIAPASP